MSAVSQIYLNHLIFMVLIIRDRDSFLSQPTEKVISKFEHLSFLPWNSIVLWWISQNQAGDAYKHHSQSPYWYHWVLIK